MPRGPGCRVQPEASPGLSDGRGAVGTSPPPSHDFGVRHWLCGKASRPHSPPAQPVPWPSLSCHLASRSGLDSFALLSTFKPASAGRRHRLSGFPEGAKPRLLAPPREGHPQGPRSTRRLECTKWGAPVPCNQICPLISNAAARGHRNSFCSVCHVPGAESSCQRF